MATAVGADAIDPQALDDLPRADVVFLGEVHDNPQHHVHQTRATHAIAPAALVFEMLTPDQAARIPPELPPEGALAELLEWDSSGWPDFAMYYPIFAAASDARIFGAGLPREQARAAMTDGAAAHLPDDPARFGLDRALDADEQARRESLQDDAHCNALPAEMLPAMVDIQRLRDALLAEAALRAHAETGGPVVVITGTGHTRTDWGAPAALALASDLHTLSIGQYEGEPDSTPPNDLWLVTETHLRTDPCAALE
ncbi:MAG: ChaN family lipoprotein [Rhodobacteraceae bacterium]|nr:ChaN family lipoprotein [Paracoccaceae bacterium]